MKAIWRVVGASVQGTAHLKREIPCQDAHAYRLLPGRVLLVAVADGAGSAPHSDTGAQYAVTSALDHLEATLAEELPQNKERWEELLAAGFAAAHQALLQHAAADELSPRAFATTLTCAVACDAWLVVGQIGDGVTVAQDEAGELFTASHPQRGEYANETFFLTSDEAFERFQVRVFPEAIQALALMTDGLIRLALNVVTHSPHPPFFNPLLKFLDQAEDLAQAESQLAAFVASERVCARTDDDKTLVLAVRSRNTALASNAEEELPIPSEEEGV